ncbi:hypothetical protein M514_24728 [Trichuris suis]|uniref:MULE transposase domain-containing protein n=1 Tax=Trichuris suis TaxID=68888 RepID=A0A085LXL9_9BILA|nr:hypothetical protein M513_12868 [Trichuris suis]KFD49715.1 hypothetical protein M513_09412 [Trichuris suis]KFD63141.1 hypothetical protein M514_24728 [Trichuris suis]
MSKFLSLSAFQVCFFHTSQCIWRKIQSSGLATQYSTDESFSLKLRHLSALAFLPADEIPGAFDEVKLHMPEEASEVVEWFENTYVHGRTRRVLRNGVAVRSPPLFPPALWSIYDCMQEGLPRTQNSIEAWHRRWKSVIGADHAGIYHTLEELRKEQRRVEIEAERDLRSEASFSRRAQSLRRDQRLQDIVNNRESRPALMDYLRAIAHNLSH